MFTHFHSGRAWGTICVIGLRRLLYTREAETGTQQRRRSGGDALPDANLKFISLSH